MGDSAPSRQVLASRVERRRASSSPESVQVTKKKKRVACRECRQAKLKCNKSSNMAEPCARCQKMSLECRVETNYKRYNKKIRIDDLAEEVERLRSSVVGSGVAATHPIATSSVASISVAPESLHSHDGPALLNDSTVASSTYPTDAPQEQSSFAASRDALPDTCLPVDVRVIGSVQLSPEDTKDLFQIFFEHHHHFLDILDSTLTPDSCYSSSPVLFWAIISVAARHYDKQPKLFSSLSQHVTSLIWSNIAVLPHSRYTIQAILLISMWPFATNSMTRDISFMLVNIAKTASMQLGLHRPEIVQDFLRVKTRLDGLEFQKAVKMWAGCFIASQCVSSSIGHPSILPSDWVIDQACDIDNQYTLPDNIRYHLLICKFIARANNVMAERERKQDEFEGLALFSMLEADFADLERRIGHKITAIHQILLSMASLQLRTFYFFVKHNTDARKQGLLKAYSTALALITRCVDAESSWGFTKYSPDRWNQILSMAAMLIMKVIHSSYARYIDAEEGERAFNSVVSLMRKASVQENDVRFRVSVVLAQLWGVHQSVSSRKDQEPSLNIKSRLGASILHDALWQWRENFGRRLDMHPTTMEPLVSVGEAEKATDLRGQNQPSLLEQPFQADASLSGFINDSFDMGDADWFWDVGFPAFLPIDVDANSPPFLSWAPS